MEKFAAFDLIAKRDIKVSHGNHTWLIIKLQTLYLLGLTVLVLRLKFRVEIRK